MHALCLLMLGISAWPDGEAAMPEQHCFCPFSTPLTAEPLRQPLPAAIRGGYSFLPDHSAFEETLRWAPSVEDTYGLRHGCFVQRWQRLWFDLPAPPPVPVARHDFSGCSNMAQWLNGAAIKWEPGNSCQDQRRGTEPAAILTCPVDPLLAVFSRDASTQAKQDAVQTLVLMSAAGAYHILHQGVNEPGRQRQRRFAHFADDLLYPEDEPLIPLRTSRPPFYFTLGIDY